MLNENYLEISMHMPVAACLNDVHINQKYSYHIVNKPGVIDRSHPSLGEKTSL